MTAEIGLQGSLTHIARVLIEEVVFLLGPPGEAIGRLSLHRLTKASMRSNMSTRMA